MNNNSIIPLFKFINAIENNKYINQYIRKDNIKKNISLIIV